MRITLSWHNSEVRGVQYLPDRDGVLRVALSAACVQREAAPADAQWGFIKDVDVLLLDATVSGPFEPGEWGDCIGSIAHGEVQVAGSDVLRGLQQMALPWSCPQPLTLHLSFRNGCELTVHAQSGACQLPPQARFIESFAC